jgi:hypothetical protein|tara:strand:+ start:1517 stop:1867 length:351 start_codon:yes stop_codon:yes gene_type:complete
MKIINPLISTNIISILPRSFSSDIGTSVVFSNEDTNLDTSITPSLIAYVSNDLQLSVEVPLFKEGERYTFKVIQGTDIIFRGTVLVTQFNDTNYTINNNEFVVNTDTDSDEMKVYE